MPQLSRRQFLQQAGLAASALPAFQAGAQPTPAVTTSSAPHVPKTSAMPAGTARLHWLEGVPLAHAGVTWGLAWPKGQYRPGQGFAIATESGSVASQSWTLATWPDGSLKWSGHALAADTGRAEVVTVTPGEGPAPAQPLKLLEQADRVVVETGALQAIISRKGPFLMESLSIGGSEVATLGHLVGSRQSQPESLGAALPEPFTGETETLVVEQSGPVRAVLKLTGHHRMPDGRQWLPFTVRLAFTAGSTAVQMTHTFVYDGDPETDFLRSLGVRWSVPLRDSVHDRHLRFGGPDGGLWGEAVRPLTGLRRDPGEAVRRAQIAGEATPPVESWSPRVSSRQHWIPTWGDFTLSQLSANGFTLKKRTKAGHAWVPVDQGGRAPGFAYVGGPTGGLAVGMRDFWQLHPTQLDLRNCAEAEAEVTVWMYSPEAPPLDVRFYHDGLGQETYAQQLDALDITYEDYEPGFGTAVGVARTTNLTFWACPATPSRERLVELAQAAAHPPQLVASPDHYHAAGVFGSLWSPAAAAPSASAQAIEERLRWTVEFYRQQVEQRHWYGFWDYGDVMHTYDADRHVWRYDIGGYAWDNSELSPDLWLWYSFLRTGDAGTFRLAEAMTRHNRDVDIYHHGRFVGFGTRHNVQHWGCSAKQLRISTAAYRRFHYFITADERTGDVLTEVTEADRQLATLQAGRKLPSARDTVGTTVIGVGTDWGSAAANWLTAWERTGDDRYRQWLENAMRAIGSHPLGFFAGGFAYNPETKALTPLPNPSGRPSVSHLSAVFGLVEVCAELNQLIDVPEFKAAWLRYCRLYNAPANEQAAEFGQPLSGTNLRVGHSRLTAYAAAQLGDTALAARAWREFATHEWGPPPTLTTRRLSGAAVLNPVDEAAWVSTNDAAQWGLAAMQNLALVGPQLP